MNETAQESGNLSLDDRLEMTRGVLNMLKNWGLRAEEMMALLDLEGKPRHMARYMSDQPLPNNPGLTKRVEHLIRIIDALRTTYPLNPDMGRRWMRQRNTKLQRRSPLAVMIEGGERGLVNVLCHLDCTYAWDMSGSKNTSCRNISG
ncbi:MAG: DUF2384 domain-containing protein [endosymbiont of Escarpia spicata]|uniref:DUF2384 domain-containing protein n=1 Tax=endosymbiont of Escarpia spicata TaxID=2200908 RepID=A0A370DTI8_9GAMM|nr:MAG: DUF2384 domain-containing protein [endosymbiont of Escarpia spicata]